MELMMLLGVLCGAMASAVIVLSLERMFASPADWTEADDWFDRDEHDLSYLEDQFEE